jgi:hypothetical protein
MTKRITDSQMLGELGETAVKKLVLEMHFIYESRGRLEAGTDGIIELRDPRSGAPLGSCLAFRSRLQIVANTSARPTTALNTCSSRTISTIGAATISR